MTLRSASWRTQDKAQARPLGYAQRDRSLPSREEAWNVSS